MEPDQGKLFIGGISWDTNEERLREYFKSFGEVVEAVIMKDRTTGRARGFGFVVFADPAVAERVVKEKHTIDGRTVEAKKAVPREDQNLLNKSNSSIHGSPGPTRTKKIFVGGLPSTVTESDFRKYFEQFGNITDVVVMYDHHTQRPRGFGFITFDTEEAVDKVLVNTFHELNGKLVEVKKAVPKEQSPGPSVRSPFGGYNYGLNRVNSFFSGFGQGYNSSLIGGYGMRMDGRFAPVSSGRTSFSPFNPTGFGMGVNLDNGLNLNYGGNLNYDIGRGSAPLYSGNSNRYNNLVNYGSSNGNSESIFSSMNMRNVWSNNGINYNLNSPSSTNLLNTGTDGLGGIGGKSINWGGSAPPWSSQISRSNPVMGSEISDYEISDNKYGLGESRFGRSSGIGGVNLYASTSNPYEGTYADLYGGSNDTTWQSASSGLNSSAFGFGLGNVTSDAGTNGPAGYSGSYNLTSRQSREN